MKVDINIELTYDDSVEKIIDQTGFSKETMINTFNTGITSLLQNHGGLKNKDRISVNTQIYDNTCVDVKNHMIKHTDYLRIVSAINIIKDMIANPSGGQIIDGVVYDDLFMLESKTLCMDAINLLRDFVLKYGVDINDDLEE